MSSFLYPTAKLLWCVPAASPSASVFLLLPSSSSESQPLPFAPSISLGLWRSFKALKRRSPNAIKAYVVFWLVIICYKTVESVADTLIGWYAGSLAFLFFYPLPSKILKIDSLFYTFSRRMPFYTWSKLVFILWFVVAQTSVSACFSSCICPVVPHLQNHVDL